MVTEPRFEPGDRVLVRAPANTDRYSLRRHNLIKLHQCEWIRGTIAEWREARAVYQTSYRVQVDGEGFCRWFTVDDVKPMTLLDHLSEV